MSGQSTSMQMENLVDALLSDERVLTASERALVTSILQIATTPTGSPQMDALVASRVMAAIGTSVFQRALGVLNQVFAQRLMAPSIPPPQTNVGPIAPVASSQAPPKSPAATGVDPLRPALPPFSVPFFPLGPVFHPQTPPLPPIPPPLDPPPPIEVPGIIFPPFIFNPPPTPPTPPLPPEPPAPPFPPLPPDPPAPPNFVPPDPPAPPTPTGTDTDTDTGIDTDTGGDIDGGGGDIDGDGGGGCYVTGTPVHMGDRSLRSIEQINAGDSVLTVDAKGRAEVAGVVKRTTYTAPETVQITFTSGDSVEVTPRHRFVASGTNLVRAKDLLKGDKVSSISGTPAEVLKVARLQRPAEVHNLKLQRADRFFASKAGILGHVVKD
jgi:Pretoxin HINT domain